MSDSSAYPWMYYYDQKEFQEAMPSLMEVGDWICGVVMGEFNEDPKVSQIITDMAISFAPGIGELCDIRDIIAVLLRWYNDPRKMQDPLEWVTFAGCAIGLVPLVGGPLKTTARFIAHYGDDVVQMAAELIALLNRIGVGNAEKWLRETRFVDYHQQLLEKLTEFLNSFIDILRSCQKSLFSLVVGLREHLKDLADWLTELRDNLGEPLWQALNYLEPYKIKILEAVGPNGDRTAHIYFATGSPTSYRTEAKPKPSGSKYPERTDLGGWKGLERDKIEEWIKENPELMKKIFKDKIEKKDKKLLDADVLENLEEFTKIVEGDLKAFATVPQEGGHAKHFFRVFGGEEHNPRLMTEERKDRVSATQPGGCWWGQGKLPETAKEWREKYAVLDKFNGNGQAVEIEILEGKFTGIMGMVAEQKSHKGLQYLPGGGTQMLIPRELATQIDEKIKAALQNTKAEDSITGIITVDGITMKFTKKPTGWKDVNGRYGWQESTAHPILYPTSLYLAPTEEQSKGEDYY